MTATLYTGAPLLVRIDDPALIRMLALAASAAYDPGTKAWNALHNLIDAVALAEQTAPGLAGIDSAGQPWQLCPGCMGGRHDEHPRCGCDLCGGAHP